MSLKHTGSGVPQHLMQEIADAYNTDFPCSFERLVSLYSHPNWVMRKLAAEYTFKLGERVMPLLYEKLEDADATEDMVYWSVKVYSKFFDAAAPFIIKLLNLEHFSNNKLLFLINAAGSLKIAEAIPALVNFSGHKNWIIRKESASAILATGKAAVPYLKEAFSSGNKDIRYWTVKLLGQILGRDAIDSFKKLLSSDKKDLRYYALTALGEIDAPEVLELVASCLGDESWLVRAQAAEILERCGRPAIKHIKKLFSEGNSDVKYWSIKVLAKVLKDEALEFLKRTLETDDSELKYCVIDALAQMNFQKAAPVLVRLFDDSAWLVRKHVASVFSKFGSQAAQYLNDLLETEENENIRYWSVQVISRSDEKNFLKLLEILKEPGRGERSFIIQALRETRNKTALPVLFELLADGQWTIRRESARTIIDFGPEIVVPYMIDKIDISSNDIEYWIFKIISSFGDGVNSVITEFIYENGGATDPEDESYKMLQKAFKLLSMLGNSKSVDTIIDIIKNRSHAQKEAMVASLSGIRNDNFIKSLLKALDLADSGVSFWIARILKNVSKSSYPLLYGALDDKNPEKRVWICKIFGEIKDPAFVPPLVLLLSDGDKNVRYEATKVLSKYESAEVFESLIKQFIEEDEEGRICIIENIKSIIDEKMITLLIDALDDASDTDGYWISKLLVETAKEHIGLLEKKHDDATESSKPKYWLKKIIDHINGVAYL